MSVTDILCPLFAVSTAVATFYLFKESKRKHELETELKLKEQTEGDIRQRIDQANALQVKLEDEMRLLNAEKLTLSSDLAALKQRLESEEKASEEKIRELNDARARMEQSFKAISGDVLKQNSETFLQLAKETMLKQHESSKGDLEKRQQAINELVQPIREKLGEVDKRLLEIDKTREKSEGALEARIKQLTESELRLQKETQNLVRALNKSDVRGQWGEMQLRRAVEYAGMLEHCDFEQQVSITTDEQKALRPDMTVHLPNQRTIIIDAKAPMDAYLRAMEQEDTQERKEELKHHARQVKDKIKQLSQKSYWKQFTDSPEFVVLFMPSEALFSAALEQDSSLIDFGASERVILATPTTLIALLLAVAYGWQQEQLTRNAQMIRDLGAELFERAKVFAEHMNKLGKNLGSAVEAYNKAASSAQSRLLVTAQKMKSLSGSGEAAELPMPSPVDKLPGSLNLE